MDDINTIEKCLAGDKKAFSFLVQKYQKKAFAHAIAILGNHEDSLDAIQDAFLDAFKALGSFDKSRQFYPWLYSILRNRCFKILSNKNKVIKVDTDYLVILASSQKETLETQTYLIEKALLELDSKDREILTLKYLDELSYEEIASMLDIPTGTVMSKLYYARIRFRDEINKFRKKENE